MDIHRPQGLQLHGEQQAFNPVWSGSIPGRPFNYIKKLIKDLSYELYMNARPIIWDARPIV